MKEAGRLQSIAHMGFVTLGLFIFNRIGLEGAIVQLIRTASSPRHFLCIGVMYDRHAQPQHRRLRRQW